MAPALETDPPNTPSASISGSYLLEKPTTEGEVFRAQIGFCSGAAGGSEMQYRVSAGSQASGPPETLDAGAGQLANVSVILPAGTMQVELQVIYLSGPEDDVVWFDPRIEAADAPAPSPRPTFTSLPARPARVATASDQGQPTYPPEQRH